MGDEEGEKNGGDNKVAPAEKKGDVSVTAVYKIDLHCDGCAQKVRKVARRCDGVEEAKTDIDANKLTIKGTNVDPTAVREKLEKILKKKVELEEKKEEPKEKNTKAWDRKTKLLTIKDIEIFRGKDRATGVGAEYMDDVVEVMTEEGEK